MAGEIQAQYPTGATLYAVLVNNAGSVWNGSAFDSTPTSGEWTTYAITMAEGGTTGYYKGDMPAASAGAYSYRVHNRVGGSAATTDPIVWVGEVQWDGTAILPLSGLAAALLKLDLSTVTGEASRSLLNAVRALRNKFAISNGIYTVYKEDDSTAAWSGPVSTDAAADPVTGMDPS